MPDNKLGADGLVPSPTMLENGHTFGAYEVVETELIMRNKLAADSIEYNREFKRAA